MGQKVNPIGLRLGVNKDWNSRWYADKKDYAASLELDFKIRDFVMKRMKNANISKVEVEKHTKGMEIVIHTSKPGVIIGKGGEELKKTIEDLKKLTNETNLQISIADIKKPELNATLTAQSIARQIENRASYRVAQKKAIKDALKSGAKGIKTKVSGRLNGAEMARSEGYSEGNTPLHTIRADIDYGFAEADTTFGKIGVKVWIYKGEILNSKKQKGGN